METHPFRLVCESKPLTIVMTATGTELALRWWGDSLSTNAVRDAISCWIRKVLKTIQRSREPLLTGRTGQDKLTPQDRQCRLCHSLRASFERERDRQTDTTGYWVWEGGPLQPYVSIHLFLSKDTHGPWHTPLPYLSWGKMVSCLALPIKNRSLVSSIAMTTSLISNERWICCFSVLLLEFFSGTPVFLCHQTTHAQYNCIVRLKQLCISVTEQSQNFIQ